MDDPEKYRKSQRNNNLKWATACLAALLVLLFVPGSNMTLEEKQLLGFFIPFEGGILLLTEEPRRIGLTILGVVMFAVGVVLGVISLTT